MFTKLILGFIRLYRQGVSPFTPPSCRFTPTCSQYAAEAIESHGAGRGGWMALKRLLRCHPLGGKGYDPVPVPDGDDGPMPSAGSGREGSTVSPETRVGQA